MKDTEGWFQRFLVFLAESRGTLNAPTRTSEKAWPSRRVIVIHSHYVVTDLGYEAATPDLTRAGCSKKKNEEKSNGAG